MGIDKTPCKGIYRILCNADLCSSDRARVSPECIGCLSSVIEIIDFDGKILNTLPAIPKEEEKKKSKPKVSQVTESTDSIESI